jgi:BirA family transcriptional regulator, biotin operon repressor / biotin---[acetyl-CoA-carboxylase] ligase
VILGMGVDVNFTATDFPANLRAIATSLRIEAGRPILRADLAVSILQELDRAYARLAAGDFAALADEWEAHCATIGQQVTILQGQRQVRGRAESLGDDGALLVRTEHGRLERIIGGDVTLEK